MNLEEESSFVMEEGENRPGVADLWLRTHPPV